MGGAYSSERFFGVREQIRNDVVGFEGGDVFSIFLERREHTLANQGSRCSTLVSVQVQWCGAPDPVAINTAPS